MVTSPTGAVIRDILHRLADRFPRRVLVWPVKVQGEGSAEQIAAAIRGFNALPERGRIPRPDLLIVARGGGSLEDLWSFNEEIVVRAAAESTIPLISAVGHETDITLIGFAADKRAPTPTAAAEIAVPVRAELFVESSGYQRRMMLCWQRSQDGRRDELRAAVRAFRWRANCWRSRGSSWMAPRRPCPRAKSQYPCAFPPLRASERAGDRPGAARAGGACRAAPGRERRADDARRRRAARAGVATVSPGLRSIENFKARQCAGAAQQNRARPRTRAASFRARAAPWRQRYSASGPASGTQDNCSRRCPTRAC